MNRNRANQSSESDKNIFKSKIDFHKTIADLIAKFNPEKQKMKEKELQMISKNNTQRIQKPASRKLSLPKL